MKKLIISILLSCAFSQIQSQHFGIVRKNYISNYFDSTLNINIDVLDSSTIRLGSINPITGIVTNIGNSEYTSGINLNGATIDPYLNRYYISKGFNIMTFDINSGNIINDVPINGPLPTGAFQNYRFNQSDSVVYGLVPNNFYSSYFDSTTMSTIQVLDSSHLRFAAINPNTGQYSLIGNMPYKNVYSLAGNSIDPHQMLYYYSAVDTFVAIDLYTGNLYSEVGIQLPQNAMFQNFTYSCADTLIYGLTTQVFVSSVYDSVLMTFVDQVDSTTARLSKINPTTGLVTIISPYSIGYGVSLNASCFIDPSTMTYYYSNGGDIVGVSLATGLVTSSVTKSLQSGAIAFDMMRSTQNCLGALKVRINSPTNINQTKISESFVSLSPNPVSKILTVTTNSKLKRIEIYDLTGQLILRSNNKNSLDVSTLSEGLYLLKAYTSNDEMLTQKFLKN